MRRLILALLCTWPAILAAQESAFLDAEGIDRTQIFRVLTDTGATFDTDWKVAASNTSGNPAVRVTNRLNLAFGCRLPNGGYLLDCVVTLTVSSRPASGGHDHHDSQRPTGTFSRLRGTVDSRTGTLTTTFTAPEVSGIIDIHGEGFHPFIGVISGDFTIGVGTEGFVELPDSSLYNKIGNTSGLGLNHLSNHFGVPEIIGPLENLAASYDFLYLPAVPLAYNDMSLEFGGIFDVAANWTHLPNGHKGHRLGRNVDLRTITIPEKLLKDVWRLANLHGFSVFDETRRADGTPSTGPHYHLTLN